METKESFFESLLSIIMLEIENEFYVEDDSIVITLGDGTKEKIVIQNL